MLATGSVALPIPGVEFGDRVLDTWGAWSLPEQPKKIAVVGAGASGSEIASAYARFGTEVLLIEMLDQILPAEDKDMARVVERTFKKQGIAISTGTPVENVEAGESSVKFTYGDETAEVDYLCIAGGRAPDVEGLGPRGGQGRAGRGRQGQGRRVPAHLEPEGLRDRRPRQRQGARPQGLRGGRRRRRARGRRPRPTRSTRTSSAARPSATRRSPASGSPRRRPRRPATTSRSASRNSAASAAATVYDDKDGMVKLVVDSKYGEILGAHIVGNRACDMIAELVATMALEGGYQELARIVHPHPTISEAILEAARAVDDWAIHA